jgi:hypothetical protein
VSGPGRRRYAYKFFAIFIVVYFWIMFAHVTVVAMWMMLASILRPTKMMPYGCAVLSLFILPIYLSRQMAQAAAAAALALRNFLDQQAGWSLRSSTRPIMCSDELSRASV